MTATRSQGKRGRDQTTKSDYEKLRDRNIAERQAALLASGLLEDIAQYKTAYLGGQKSANKLCPAASASTERPIRMLKCKQCPVQVPLGLMASHKEYYHAKTKVSKSTLGNSNKRGNVIGASEIKCDLCDEKFDQKMMAMHKKYYHTPSLLRSPQEMGFQRQQDPSKHQKLTSMRDMARKQEQGKTRDLFMRKEVARKKENLKRKEAARGLENDHTYARSFSNESLEAGVIKEDWETDVKRKRPADECFPDLLKSSENFLHMFRKPIPVRELFPVQELDLVQKQTPVQEIILGLDLPLVRELPPVHELHPVQEPLQIQEVPQRQNPVLQLPQVQEQPNVQKLPHVLGHPLVQEPPSTSSKAMKCDQCDNRFPVDVDEGVLVHHIKTTHMVQLPKEQPEPTGTSEESVPSQEVLMSSATSGSAQDVAWSSASPPSSPPVPAEEATVTCPICSDMLGSWNLLTIHIQHYHCEQQVIQSYPCPHCPASFQGPNNLLTHVTDTACRTKRERMKTEDDQCVSLVSDGEEEGIEKCLNKKGNKEESKVHDTDFVVEKIPTNESSCIVIDEEEEVKKEFVNDKEISLVHCKTVAMEPSTAFLPPEDTKSKAQHVAEELARKGFNVSLVSPEQQSLQNTVGSLKVADKQLYLLLAKVRKINIQEEGREG